MGTGFTPTTVPTQCRQNQAGIVYHTSCRYARRILMLNLIDDYMQCIDGKVPDDCLRLLRDELSEMLMHYTIQPISTDLTVYEGYIPQCFAAYCVTKKIEGTSDETMRNNMTSPFSKLTSARSRRTSSVTRQPVL